MLGYLTQGGPYHPKHGGGDRSTQKTEVKYFRSPLLGSIGSTTLPPLHPSLAFITHYSIAIPSILLVHDAFFFHPDHSDAQEESTTQRQIYISRFLFIYTIILFSTRYLSSYHAGRLRFHSVLYELTWLCNSTLVLGCLCFGEWHNRIWLLRKRPLVATASCVAVSIDQVLWYVDLVVWLVIGKFPIGAMKYLTWKQTLWIDRFTCTHHLWTIPLLLYAAGSPLTWDSLKLSVFIVMIHVLLSRWLTPHCIQRGLETNYNTSAKQKDPQQYRYLNVNLSHELWQDITSPFLQISKGNPPCWLYLFRLIWRWQLFNFLVFVGVLCPISRWIAS